jgi:RNA polymerase sigma factor (sigma-70 family)
MAADQVCTVLRHLKSAAFVPGCKITDGQLLEQYLTDHSEVAFEAILRRHGPMVLGVCRRILENRYDAEDAFQATFLVLVRKGDSIAPRGAVGNWLYGVAYRTSMKARAMNAKRRVKERTAAQRVGPVAPADLARCDLQTVLDQELNRLPEKYRAPLVLCDLEGKTRSEAACQIGCPDGTVATRLVKARALLAKALTRRGLALSGGGVALVLTQSAAAVPVPLLSSTIKAACAFAAGPAAAGLVPTKVVALTEGVLKAMSMNKTKSVLVALFAAGLLTVAGLLPSAMPQGPAPQSKDKRDDFSGSVQRDAGTTTSFLEVGKIYEFTPASKWGPFQGKVMATRGEQWVRVVDMQGEGMIGAGPTWVNLNQMAFIADVAGSGRNRQDLQKK